jgi:hypothetical protein
MLLLKYCFVTVTIKIFAQHIMNDAVLRQQAAAAGHTHDGCRGSNKQQQGTTR